MSAPRYPTPEYRRNALAPGLLAAIALLAGIGFREADGFLVVRFAVAILGAIVAVFAWQARHFWWIPALAVVVVLWNPVFPFAFGGDLWLAAQYLAVALFIACAILVKERNPDDRNARRR